MTLRRYPLQPLADTLAVPVEHLARRTGVSGSTWKEYRTIGVSEKVADRLACKVGLHPYMVWPDMADDAIDDEVARSRAQRAAAERRRYWADTEKRERKRETRRRYYAEHGGYERARERRKPYDPVARRARYLRAKVAHGKAA